MSGPVTAGFKMGEKFFEAIGIIISSKASVSQKSREELQKKASKMFNAKKRLVDYAVQFGEDDFPDVLLGLSDLYQRAIQDYETFAINMAVDLQKESK